MIFFWILWAIDAVVAAIAIFFFFFAGLGDGSISSFNIGLWAGILIVLAVILGGSYYLRAGRHLTFAKIILAMLAVPALLFVLYFFIAIVSGAKWN